jgi:iron complex transport system substrate-binding protein
MTVKDLGDRTIMMGRKSRKTGLERGGRICIPKNALIAGFVIIVLHLIILSCGCTASGVPEGYPVGPERSGPEEIIVIDSLNRSVLVPSPAQRLVILGTDSIELLYALDVGDRIVGIADNAFIDPDLEGKLVGVSSVGNRRLPSPEIMLTLKPDLVIMTTSRTNNIDLLETQKLTIFYVNCYELSMLNQEARVLGEITGQQEKAQEYIDFNNKYIGFIRSRVPADSSLKHMAIYAERYNEYQPEGGGSNIDQMIMLLNGTNIAHNLSGTTKVNPEWVLEMNPDIILGFESNSNIRQGKTQRDKYEAFFNRTGADRITAIKNKRVYVLQADMFYSPKAVVGLVYLAKILYPAEFADIDPDDVLHEYEEKFLPVPFNSQIVYPPQ